MTDEHDVIWTPDKVGRFWDSFSARRPGHYFSAMHAQALARWIDRRARPGRHRLIDLGCGNGDLIAELARRGYSPLGIDSSPASLRVAARRVGDENVRLGSVTSIPVEDASATGILLIETIEHVLDEDLGPMMSEILRVLQDGAPLVITTPNAEDIAAAQVTCPDCRARFHPMQHVRSWTADGLRQFLEGHGFDRIETVTTRLPRGNGVPALLRRAIYALRGDRPFLIAIARPRR